MFTINFRLRQQKKANLHTVYVRVRVNGILGTDFATNVKTTPERWDCTRQRIKGNQEDNNTLDNVVNDLKRIMNHWHDIGRPFTANEVKSHYTQRNAPPPTVLEVYQMYIERVKSKEGLSPSTLQKWHNAKDNLKNYLATRGKKDLRLSEVNEATATDLYNYLIAFVKNDHALRNVNNLGHVLQYAVKLKYLDKNLLSHDFKRSKPKPKTFLSLEQIQKLKDLPTHGILEDVRKLAYIVCLTGVDYSDLKALFKAAAENLSSNVIKIDRGKNEQMAFVPLLKEVREVLESYQYVCPNLHLNVFNRHLHTFEGLLNIDFSLTTKILRKTGGNYFLQKGVALHVVSRILGHTSVVTTQKYYADTLQSIIVENQTSFLFNI